jgi:hypothetical protein
VAVCLKPRRLAVFSAQDHNVTTFPHLVREDNISSPLQKSKADYVDQIASAQEEVAFCKERFWPKSHL